MNPHRLKVIRPTNTQTNAGSHHVVIVRATGTGRKENVQLPASDLQHSKQTKTSQGVTSKAFASGATRHAESRIGTANINTGLCTGLLPKSASVFCRIRRRWKAWLRKSKRIRSPT